MNSASVMSKAQQAHRDGLMAQPAQLEVQATSLSAAELAAPPRPGLRARITRRLRQRWPEIRRTLPRDLLILLWLAIALQYVGIAFVATDSVNTSLALVLKGATPKQGELAVFAYQGGQLERYYPDGLTARVQRLLGMKVSLAGPRKNDGFIKYLVGVPGDRVEVAGDRVYLNTARGRFDMGRCKPASRLGVPLTPIKPQTIPPGYVYMWSPHVDGLDSRYDVVGLMPASAIAGKGVRLW